MLNGTVKYFITIVVCEDITKISQQEELIPQNFYDIVIEKGCVDCLLSSPEEKISLAFSEIKNIMTKTGVFYSFSYCEPEKRIPIMSEIFSSINKIEKFCNIFVI